ncbi:hypothetical protein PY254_14415 [Rhodanobacter sp. AS-Z3]|uniref:hypothetical protein n=1 Tax=Rhodanobacter sp. AS-Z3 TaxID=3031330 RepID=UPI0024785897|nr:hypothetical protein [Rhodanobacter sp. AS-Z3]WEN14415.1 hypothetical protein PY254_14415 [Rhodanobacter sp. AS-Z3]
MTRRFSGAGKLAVIGLAVAAAVAMPLSASARGHDYHRGGGYHSSYDRGYYGGQRGGYYGHGGHWSGGRWIAGAIVAGAVIGLVDSAMRPAPVYYGAPAYREQRTVVYRDVPVVRRRVVETRTVVYDDGYQTRYVRDDGYDGDDD